MDKHKTEIYTESMGKISVNDNSQSKTRKKENALRRNFYMNFNLSGGPGVDFIEMLRQLMQAGSDDINNTLQRISVKLHRRTDRQSGTTAALRVTHSN